MSSDRRIVLLLMVAALFCCGGSAHAEAEELAFVRLTDGFWQVWVRNMADDRETQWTTSRSDKRYPGWGRGGSIYFRTNNQELWSVKSPGAAEEAALESSWPVQDAVYDVSSRQIAAVRMGAHDPDWTTLWVYDGESSTGTLLLPSSAGRLRLWPVWSPTGDEIFVVDSKPGEGSRIVAVPAGGGAAREVSSRNDQVAHLSVSPDGRWIAYAAGTSGDRDIWIVPTAGGGSTQLTRRQGFDSEPTWSPDGSELAYVTDRRGQLEIWRMRTDGSEAEVMIAGPGPVRSPAWR